MVSDDPTGDGSYVLRAGSDMTGNLTFNTNNLSLNATSGDVASIGDGVFGGKVTAATEGTDNDFTVTTKGFVDQSIADIPPPGDGQITIVQPGIDDQTFTVNWVGWHSHHPAERQHAVQR